MSPTASDIVIRLAWLAGKGALFVSFSCVFMAYVVAILESINGGIKHKGAQCLILSPLVLVILIGLGWMLEQPGRALRIAKSEKTAEHKQETPE